MSGSALWQAKETMTIDKLAGVSVVLSKLSSSNSNFWSGKEQELIKLAAALPAFHAACFCQDMFTKYDKQKNLPDDKWTTQCGEFLLAFANLSKEVGSLGKHGKAVEVHEAVLVFHKVMTDRILKLVGESIVSIRKLQARVNAVTKGVDLDALLKNFEANSDQIVNFEKRVELLEDLKMMNGITGAGLKLFDKLVSALSAVGCVAVEGPQTFAALREQFVNDRQKGRLLVWTRSAVVVIKKNKASDVDSLNNELKLLKVRPHKIIKSKLADLGK